MSGALVALATAFTIAVILTPLLRRVAHRVGYLDVPGTNSSHEIPVPRSGGYAIVLGIIVATLVAGGPGDRDMAVILAGAAALAVVAAIDELRALPRFGRFVVQILIAAAIAYGGHVILARISLPYGIDVRLGTLAGVAAIVWVVGMINAYNFMDGLNGMASVEGIVCGIAFALLSLSIDDSAGAIVAAAAAGACAGFLPWNLPSGSIFMGDVGSAGLGFLFALLSLRLASIGVPFVATALPLTPFLFDSSITVLRRAAAGERFFATRHRSHFYQRLNRTGVSHGQVTMVYGLLALVSSAVALTYTTVADGLKAIMLLGVLAMHIALAAWVTAREHR